MLAKDGPEKGRDVKNTLARINETKLHSTKYLTVISQKRMVNTYEKTV